MKHSSKSLEEYGNYDKNVFCCTEWMIMLKW